MSIKRKKRGEAASEDAFSRILESAPAETEKQNKKEAGKGKKTGRKLKRAALVAAIVACFFLLLFCGLGLWGHFVSASEYNFPNLFLDGIDVGGLTKAQTLELLEKEGWDERVGGEMSVKIPGDVSFKLNYVNSGARYSAEEAADAAYDYGRSANVFNNLFAYLKGHIIPADVDMSEKAMNEDYIRGNLQRGISLMEHT